jgi:hypothetical protein
VAAVIVEGQAVGEGRGREDGTGSGGEVLLYTWRKSSCRGSCPSSKKKKEKDGRRVEVGDDWGSFVGGERAVKKNLLVACSNGSF